MNILDKTLKLNIEDRVSYWLEIAKEIEERENYKCLIEYIDDAYLKDKMESDKLYGFYEDENLESFFKLNNVNFHFKSGNIRILSCDNNLYGLETIELPNRKADNLKTELFYKLDTLAKI